MECEIELFYKLEYELHYKASQGEDHPDAGKPFRLLRLDKQLKNELYCQYTNILYTNPNDAPEDEVALICVPSGTGIMMEWERPISKLCPFLQFEVHLRRTPLLGRHPIQFTCRANH